MTTSVYLSNEEVTVVSGKALKKKVKICSFETVPMPEGAIINGKITDDDAVRSILTTLRQGKKIPKKNVRLVIDSSSVMDKIERVPAIANKKLLDIAKNTFIGMVDAHEELLYDYSVVEGHNTDGKGCTILCSAIEKNMIDSYISIFKESGIEINSIDIGLNCVIKLLKYFKNLSKQTYILLGLDANNMVSLLFADGKYHISNRNRLLSERGTSESISEIVRVVSSLIQFNKSQKNESDISCTYFCGLRENEKWLNHQVSNSLNIQSTPFPMGQAVSVKRKIAQKGILQGNYLYAIGNLITK